MDDQRIGSVVRAVRIRRRWRQIDLAGKAGVSPSTVSRIERGHFDRLSIRTLRAIAAALDIRLELIARWRAGDLDRLLNARHSQLHELVAEAFLIRYQGWALAPEVSFSIYGERGVIDLLAWNAAHRSLLVIELKTDIADVNELLGTFDRKVRLARSIGAERGWVPLEVSGWVIVAPGRTNRERIAAHRAVLRVAFPRDGRRIDSWLRRPVGRCSGLSIWRNSHPRTAMADLTPIRRVRPKARRRPERGDAQARGESPGNGHAKGLLGGPSGHSGPRAQVAPSRRSGGARGPPRPRTAEPRPRTAEPRPRTAEPRR